ncbi:MAG: biotin--[acetyl-CoA-carboxylase] ligase [Ruminococcaceae bacterium]|nr:biotin--[acetyl-CoA-carboxylase] ligase [Oscillospiraceae bacterium]
MRRLNTSYIQRHCGVSACVFEEVTSTNAILKEYAKQGAPALSMVVAAAQSAGRGRGEHTFFSPKGSGIYLSVLLHPEGGFAPADITAAAAVAACDAVQSVCGLRPDIKWMNDLYVRGKKVAGILCEAVTLPERTAVIVGIGINLLPPEGGFPAEIAARAGAVLENSRVRFLREKVAIAFFRALEARVKNQGSVYAAYRQGLFVLGMEVTYEGKTATVSDLLPDFRLELTFADGEKRFLHSGEISLPLGKSAQ